MRPWLRRVDPECGAVWVYMAGAYYFTNVGAALGIHAA